MTSIRTGMRKTRKRGKKIECGFEDVLEANIMIRRRAYVRIA